MKNTFILILFSLCACSPMHPHRYKMSQVIEYEAGVNRNQSLSYAEKQTLIWGKIQEIFPEHYYEADRLLRHSLRLDERIRNRATDMASPPGGKKGLRFKEVPSDIQLDATIEDEVQEYLKEVRVFWGMVDATAHYEEREHQASWQRAAPILREASRDVLILQQQQQRQYDDLNRSLREDRPIHCTSQYRPWGNGMVDTTCY